MSEVQKRVTTNLAEAFNLLAQARLDGIRTVDLTNASRLIAEFQEIIAALNSGALVVTEQVVGEGDANETE